MIAAHVGGLASRPHHDPEASVPGVVGLLNQIVHKAAELVELLGALQAAITEQGHRTNDAHPSLSDEQV